MLLLLMLILKPQAITPNIRESHLEKALRELEDAKIIEHCEEDRLSVAFFR